MRSLLRALSWGAIVGGSIAQWLGPAGRTYVPFIVIGVVLLIASAVRPGKEETDYTAVMLDQAGYLDPDKHLPAGVEPQASERKPRGFAFLVWLFTIVAILWPIHAEIFDRVERTTGIDLGRPTDSATPFDDDWDATELDLSSIEPAQAELTGLLADGWPQRAAEMLAQYADTSTFTSVHFRADSVSGDAVTPRSDGDVARFVMISVSQQAAAGTVQRSDLEESSLDETSATDGELIDISEIDYAVLADSLRNAMGVVESRTGEQVVASSVAVRNDLGFDDADTPAPTYSVIVDTAAGSYLFFFDGDGALTYSDVD